MRNDNSFICNDNQYKFERPTNRYASTFFLDLLLKMVVFVQFLPPVLHAVERRRGRVVRAAWLWHRKSPYRVSSRLGFAMRRLENSLCQPNSKWVPFSNKGRIRQRMERDGLRLSLAVPKIQWDSNPHCPYV